MKFSGGARRSRPAGYQSPDAGQPPWPPPSQVRDWCPEDNRETVNFVLDFDHATTS
jgi:hypothetical protein